MLATWHSEEKRCIPMVCLNGVLVTPDHPVYYNEKWQLPSAIHTTSNQWVDSVFDFHFLNSPCLFLRGGENKFSEKMEYVECCTLGQPVPGHADFLWGSHSDIQCNTIPPWLSCHCHCLLKRRGAVCVQFVLPSMTRVKEVCRGSIFFKENPTNPMNLTRTQVVRACVCIIMCKYAFL